jgi:hypothetical protein
VADRRRIAAARWYRPDNSQRIFAKYTSGGTGNTVNMTNTGAFDANFSQRFTFNTDSPFVETMQHAYQTSPLVCHDVSSPAPQFGTNNITFTWLNYW